MEKRVFIAIILSAAVMYGYSFLVPPPVRKAPAPVATQGQVSSSSQGAVTVLPATPTKPVAYPVAQGGGVVKDVVVDTDRFEAVFSTQGGALRKVLLKGYRESVAKDSPLIALLNEVQPNHFAFQTTGKGIVVPPGAIFTASAPRLSVMGKGSGSLDFTWMSPTGTTLVKRYTFSGDSFSVGLEERVTSPTPVAGSLQLLIPNRIPAGAKDSRFDIHGTETFTGNAVKSETPKNLAKKPAHFDADVLWTGYGDKYFFMALLASKGSIASVDLSESDGFLLQTVSTPTFNLPPGGTVVIHHRIFLGPKDLDILKAQGSKLEDVINFGWFSAIAKPLLYVLKFFHRYIGNYGVAIIILTVILKILFYPLTYKSYRSMKEMQKLQPKMAELKEKYKNDRDALNKAIMELYQTHKVNPLGGCLPMVIQIPVFFALYRALMYSIELRHAPFALWITDLSAKDPYYVTPIIMGVTMVIQQRMTPSQMDPTQQKMMMALPVVFTFMFLNFPSGLVIYWLVNNILTIAQQAYINKSLKDA